MTITRLGTHHQSLPRLHALGLGVARPFLEALAHLVSTPFHAGGIGPIVGAAPRLGLSLGLLLGLGCLLVLAALPRQARRRPDSGPDGGSLPSIAADSATDGAEGRPGAGKTPEDGFVFVEQYDLTPTGSVLQGSKFEGRRGEVCGLGLESSSGAAIG